MQLMSLFRRSRKFGGIRLAGCGMLRIRLEANGRMIGVWDLGMHLAAE
jgi:fructose-1,6-bisphosphatase/inositol monophosphatase family enzyme